MCVRLGEAVVDVRNAIEAVEFEEEAMESAVASGRHSSCSRPSPHGHHHEEHSLQAAQSPLQQARMIDRLITNGSDSEG